MHYKISEMAEMAKLSVRMLHHYDKIGLLKPESVSPAGYRLYTDADVERLQQILFFKELDFTLREIKEILESPHFNRKKVLVTQRELLIKKRERLGKIIGAIEKTIQSIEGGAKMDQKEMFEGFDMGEIEKYRNEYEAEVREKYPQETVEECYEKTDNYSGKEWAMIQAISQVWLFSCGMRLTFIVTI